MKLTWLPLRLGDFVGIAFIIAILGLFVIAAVGYPNAFHEKTNSGFGPEWDCTQTGNSGPICVKRIDPINKN
ncbi:MAG: hypothetical protein WCA28_30500 [Bradyrhizobium sp.]